MRLKLEEVLLIPCWLATAALTRDDVKKPHKPHIFLIVSDDLGFNDVPWHNKDVVAPNLQQLATQGVILEQSYVLPICSPTRSALLTGIYPFAVGRQGSVIWPLDPTGLTTDAYVIPQLLKPLGYSTHAIGKWHLGFCNWKYTPTDRGFDTFRGYYTGSEDYYSHIRLYGPRETGDHHLYPDSEPSSRATYPSTDFDADNSLESTYPYGYDFRNNREPYMNASGVYSTYELASHVDSLLHATDASVPKFVYLAFQSVHAPLQVPENYTKPYMKIKDIKRRTYLGMVTAMDEAIGRIISAMKKTGHYDNSVIIFTTDNGGPTVWGGNNWPLRGNKTTLWEGGTRGAAFVHSPQLAKKGVVSNNLIHATDWMSTIVNLAGGLPPTMIDSVDQWDGLNGRTPPPRKEMVYNLNYSEKLGVKAAIRVGDYKLIIGDPGPGEWTPPPDLAHKKSNSLRALHFDIQRKFNNMSFEDHYQLIREKKKDCGDHFCFKKFLKTFREKLSKIETNDVLWRKIMKTLKTYLKTNRKLVPSRDKRNVLTDKINHPKTDAVNSESTKLRGKESEKVDGDTVAVKYDSDQYEDAVFSTQVQSMLNEFENYIKNGHVVEDNSSSVYETDETNLADKFMSNVTAVRLYNIKVDPEERTNLAEKYKDKVLELTNHLLAYKDRYVRPDEPKEDPRGNPKYWDGVWSPGWC